METRRFGRTNYQTTVAVFGACALGSVTQERADAAMEEVIAAGVNQIDVAPSYGEAELRLGPWLARERERFFLGCKTLERTAAGAAAELHRSLQRLQVEQIDLYQFHAVNNFAALDDVTHAGGALEAVVAARDAGLVRYIGITGHGLEAPAVFREALRRFAFDAVMFPLNPAQLSIPTYHHDANELLQQCRTEDVGVLIIKATAAGPWGGREQCYDTWYRPFDDAGHIQRAVDFVLSHDVTGFCTASDTRLLSLLFGACENYTKLGRSQCEAMLDGVIGEPLFS
jgi:aryl-alcohol dehydrogenase-like predicted oxidoreductase